jgi:hypothetical protein
MVILSRAADEGSCAGRWTTQNTPPGFASWREVPRFARDDRAQGSITR